MFDLNIANYIPPLFALQIEGFFLVSVRLSNDIFMASQSPTI